jgi:hypothetical protein
MMLLGLLILAAAIVFGIDLVAENAFGVPDPVIFGNSLGITSGRSLFVLGVLVGAGIVLGLGLLLSGIRRRSARAISRRQERRAHREVADERAALEAENAELRRHLEEERVARAAADRPVGAHERAGERGYADEPGRVREPGYADEPGRVREPGYADERGRVADPTVADERGRRADPAVADERGGVADPAVADERGRDVGAGAGPAQRSGRLGLRERLTHRGGPERRID